MAKIDRKGIGDTGELRAADFLSRKGYALIGAHYRYRRGEIDLIVQKEDLLVFVEVKTRNNLHYGPPEQFVSRAQQTLIIQAADAYIMENDWQGRIRFDIVAIVPGKEIVHFEDAFY